MKQLSKCLLIIVMFLQLQACAAAVLGGAGVGAYYLGKYYGSKQEAYKAYYEDSIKHGVAPLSYKDWKKIQ